MSVLNAIKAKFKFIFNILAFIKNDRLYEQSIYKLKNIVRKLANSKIIRIFANDKI